MGCSERRLWLCALVGLAAAVRDSGAAVEHALSPMPRPAASADAPWKPIAAQPAQEVQAAQAARAPGSPLRVVATTEKDQAKLARWRQIADEAKVPPPPPSRPPLLPTPRAPLAMHSVRAQVELQKFGGATNVTIMPYGTAHMEACTPLHPSSPPRADARHYPSPAPLAQVTPHHADRFPDRQLHDILGESEDPGGCARPRDAKRARARF